MCFVISKRLRKNKKSTSSVGFGIGYSRSVGGGFYHTRKLSSATDNENKIYEACKYIYDAFIEDLPIRKISISLGKLENTNYEQLNLFETVSEEVKDNTISDVLDDITKKYGDNSILKASSLLNYSTIKNRNTKMGGHNKE